jgi:hypothetical protein
LLGVKRTTDRSRRREANRRRLSYEKIHADWPSAPPTRLYGPNLQADYASFSAAPQLGQDLLAFWREFVEAAVLQDVSLDDQLLDLA